MTPQETAAALGAAGIAAYRMTLVGHAAPIVEWYRERITHPEPGDLVVEVSSFDGRAARGLAHEAVGTLFWHGTATYRDDVEGPWTEEERTGREEFWDVIPLTGGESVRWTNAEFIAIPRSPAQAREWSKEPARAEV